MTEYGLILSVVAGAVIGALAMVGDALTGTFINCIPTLSNVLVVIDKTIE